MGYAEKATGRTKRNLEALPGHDEHFTSMIQVKQGCQGLLLLWLCQQRKLAWLAGCLHSADYPIPMLGWMDSKIPIALAERSANPSLLGIGFLRGIISLMFHRT